MYKDNTEVAMLTHDDAEELADTIGRLVYRWMMSHPKTTEQVVSDMVLATLEGYISGNSDRRKEEKQ